VDKLSYRYIYCINKIKKKYFRQSSIILSKDRDKTSFALIIIIFKAYLLNTTRCFKLKINSLQNFRKFYSASKVGPGKMNYKILCHSKKIYLKLIVITKREFLVYSIVVKELEFKCINVRLSNPVKRLGSNFSMAFSSK